MGASMNREIDSREAKLMAAVDALTDDIAAFTAKLVTQDSTLGNEQSVLAVMETELEHIGMAPLRVPIDPQKLEAHPGFAPVPWSYDGRYNVVATRKAEGRGGKSALFNGHLDVVSPEPIGRWDRDPFEPYEKDGWLYGRGSGDMKAGVAAMTYAVKAVEKAGMGLRAPVVIEAVIEEECSGNGALACRAAGYDAEAVLIPEPFGPTVLTSQVGVTWFKVTLEGVPKHALETHSGVNAIEKCYPLFAALRRLETELNDEAHPAFEGVVHPANLNIGMINSGDWPSTVPALAEFHCRLGFLPGIAWDRIRERVVTTLREATAKDAWLRDNPPRIEFYGFRSEGHVLDSNLPAFRALSGCHQSLKGEPAAVFRSTATTDLRAFVHYGRGQATCFGPISENIHAENECVNIESVMHTARVYALFLSRWCGLIH